MAQDPGPKVIPVGSDGVEGVKIKGRNAGLGTLLDAVTVTGAGTPVTGVSGEEALITVTDAGVFAVQMEGSKDGATWYALPSVRLDDGSYSIITSITAEGAYAVDISGFSRVRANCTANDGTALTVA